MYAFNRTVDRIAGKTELQVTAGETGFDEGVLETVQSAASVRVAVPVIEAVVDTTVRGEGSLLVLGVDMTGDRSLRDYDLESGDEAVIEDPLVFLAQPDSIIVTREFARSNGLHADSRVTLGTALGPRRFTVRGIMKASGLSSAFGGNLAVMDIYAAQKMFGRGRTFDRIDLAVKPGRTIADCQRELRGLLGPGFQIAPPSARGQQFESMTAAYSMMVNISSLFALFIGMFIIYNSFAIAVTQRRSEIGILRALGATRRQIRWLFLGESAVTGVVGSLGGLAFGLLIARAIAAHDRRAHQRRLRCRAARGGNRRQPLAAGTGAGDRRRHERGRGARAGEERRADRSGAGAAKGEGPGAVGRREPVACRGGRHPRRRLDRLPDRRRLQGGLLFRLPPRDRGRAAAGAARRAGPGAPHPAAAEVAASGRGRARRRQPDPVPAPHLGERRRSHAVAGAGGRVRRDGARQLRLDHRLDGHGPQSRPVRPAVARHRPAHAPVSGVDGARAGRGGRRGARADGAGRPGRVPQDAGDDRCRGRAEPGGDRTADAGRRRRRRDVSPDGRGPGADGQRQPGAAAAPPARGGAGHSGATRRDPPADRRHRRRLLRPAGDHPDRSQPVRPLLAR